MNNDFGCLFYAIAAVVIAFICIFINGLASNKLQQELDAAPVTIKIYNAHTFYHNSDSCAYCKYLKDKPK